MDFEWDEAKAKSNLAKHGIDFQDAAKVFSDPSLLDDEDLSFIDGEERYSAIGTVEGRILYVAYTYREDRIRLISARAATPLERKRYASV